ncbi:MAG TPA: HAMP domain-containing sensor histidine kinase [Longimicrobiales bacterium]|nr:HAMP domain-containing sensor histidine kinase [Longimicrobiales bacterium]
MKYLRRHGTHRSRSAFVAGLLVVTLVLAGVLAHQAQDSARSHRAAAESALRDFAAFAGGEFGHRVEKTLDEHLVRPALWIVLGADDTLGYPATQLLRKGLDNARYQRLPVRTEFSYSLLSGDLTAVGAPISAEVRAWIADSLAVTGLGRECPCWEYDVSFPRVEGPAVMIVHALKGARPERPDAAFGLIADAQALRGMLAADFYGASLLPASLTGDVPNDSLLAVRVTAPDGRVLFASERTIDASLGVVDTLRGSYRGLVVETSMRPEAAEALVIGGLPRSRLPLLLVLLAVTSALIAAAILQLRREYELARLRSEFVSSVSHELRTPLAQIRMFGETLLLGRVRSEHERIRSLEIIDQESRRLTYLVENVLQFSRSERQVLRVEPSTIALGPLVRATAETFAPLAESAGTKLAVRADDHLVVEADAQALRQVLLNLLDNAVKYGGPGQTITVGCVKQGDAAHVWVDDEGAGVAPADRERVWDAFWRTENASDSGVAGAGIGLSVVSDIATLHGGDAWVEGSPSGGARFVVALPGARRFDRALEEIDVAALPEVSAGGRGAATDEPPGAAMQPPATAAASKEQGDGTGEERDLAGPTRRPAGLPS